MTALLLGVRLAFAGGRQSLLRGAMTAAGVALGVLVLLIAASVPAMIDDQEQRRDARAAVFAGGDAAQATPSLLLIRDADTTFRGDGISGRLLQADGARAAVPPGVRELPGPGEMVVSPALAELLRSEDGALLRQRLDARIVGTVGDAGLTGPSELLFYAGADDLDVRDGASRINGFGGGVGPDPLPAFLTFLVAVAVVVLLLPIAAFIATAVRFGGEDRDRRLAALRLVGADRGMAARVAAGETLAGALAGLLAGIVLFGLARPLAEHVHLEGISVFPADVTPRASLAALVVVAVPVAAVVSSLVALRRVVIEPLGVLRRGAEMRRRLWWRLLPAIAGGLWLFSMRDGLLRSAQDFDEYRAAFAVLLVLVGLTAVLPWVVEAVVRRLGGGGLPWQLATRRLQMDGGTAARVVSGVAVAVAGAIALQTLFAAAERVSTFDSDEKGTTADLVVSTYDDGVDEGITVRTAERLRAIPGVEGVSAVRNQFARHAGDDYATNVIVGDCASLRQQARLPSCEDGDVFLTAAIAGEEPTAEPRHTLILGEQGAGTDRWRIPADARVVASRAGPDGSRTDGVLATPEAIPGVRITSPVAQTYLDVAPGGTTGDTIELVRNEIAAVSPSASVATVTDTTQLSAFRTVRRAIFAGTTIVLLLLGASLLVGGLEQLRERRRVLAVLAAFGTPRATMAWSVLLQAAVPVVLGLSVSLTTGIALGWLLLEVGNQPLIVDWWAVGGMIAVGAAVVLLVTALTLPALVRLTSPEGLRTE